MLNHDRSSHRTKIFRTLGAVDALVNFYYLTAEGGVPLMELGC